MTGIGYGIVRLGSVVCSSWQSFLQERPYATAYWPFSVRESCTSNPNPPGTEYPWLGVVDYGKDFGFLVPFPRLH